MEVGDSSDAARVEKREGLSALLVELTLWLGNV